MKILKILISILLIIFAKVEFSSAQLSEKELLSACEKFIKTDNLFSENKLSNSKKSVKTIVSNKTLLAYVVELQPEGFVIFSTSKKMYPVIAYSEKGWFDFRENENNATLTILKTNMECQLESLKSGLTDEQLKKTSENEQAWDRLINKKNTTKTTTYISYFGPNLPDVWGGVNCKDENGDYIITATYFTPNNYSPGCVGTSLSQILHMFEWPLVGMGEHTDVDDQGSSQGSYYAGFGRMWYDWDNMLDEYHYKVSNDTERRAIGRIAYHCGVAVDMEYESSGSTSNVNRTPTALINYFRTTGHYEDDSWTYFWPRLRTNIENGSACQFAVRNTENGAGHANVCDGWRQETESDPKYYHLNNGWWNAYGCNLWYALQVSFSDCGYDAIDGAVFDIWPDPMFSDEIIRDETDSRTFTIKWNVSKNVNWEAFELQESKDNGTWTTISDAITDTFYTRTVASEGVYKYQVRAKYAGAYYANSYSEVLRVPVEKIVYLNFDGDDSFYIKDNPVNDLDISSDWTVETWVEVDSRSSGTYPVILDRKTVFSMFLIDDTGAGDYGIRFVARDVNGNIIASVQSDTNADIYFTDWVHVAVSRSGTTTKMFINGTEVASSTDVDFNLSASTNPLNVGARYWSTYERYIDGRLDEIRISDIARYTSNFCPDRFNRFNKDDNTRILMCLDAFVGTKVKDYAYNFVKRDWRASANDPGWASATCPIIMEEPEDMALCQGSVDFSVTAVQAGSYQWFEDTGSGYIALSDGGIYSGTTTATLSISDISGMDGYKYRCIVGNNSGSIFGIKDCSREATLTVYSVCTTWDGSSWSNGEPDLTKSALIAGDYTLPYDIIAKDLTIQSPYNVIVPPNLTLTVQDYFENHGTVTLQSNNNQIPTGALTLYGIQNNFGTFVAQRYVSAPSSEIWNNWHLFALPFENNPLISDIFSGSYSIYENNEATYSWDFLEPSDRFPLNNGCLLRLKDAGQTVQYSGEFGNGSYSNSLVLTSGTNLGWHLIKNPYPSPIDWNASSGWTRDNVNTTIYTFDIENNGGSNQYSTWDGNTGTYSGSRYINSFQAFFVQATADGATLNFDNNIRVKNSVAGNYLKTKDNISDILKLSVISPNNKDDEIVLYSGNSMSLSRNIKPMDSDAPDLFISEDNQEYVIKRFLDSENKITIPISIFTSEFGDFNFFVREINKEKYNIFLIDEKNNKTYELNEGLNINFKYEDVDLNRFFIVFVNKNSTVENIKDTTFLFSTSNTINIHRENNETVKANLYSVDGKLIQSIMSKDEDISFKEVNKGIYIVNIIYGSNVISKKIIVN